MFHPCECVDLCVCLGCVLSVCRGVLVQGGGCVRVFGVVGVLCVCEFGWGRVGRLLIHIWLSRLFRWLDS